jgi:hypothetical protein
MSNYVGSPKLSSKSLRELKIPFSWEEMSSCLGGK